MNQFDLINQILSNYMLNFNVIQILFEFVPYSIDSLILKTYFCIRF